MEFYSGQCFNSFALLEETVKSYEASNYVNLWKRDSRTIEGQLRRTPDKVFNPAIVYTELKYSCQHGGRKHCSESKGHRPNTHTTKIGCEFKLSLRASKDGQSLVVKDYHNAHNHEVSQALHKINPYQRRLDECELLEVEGMLSVGANRKKVRQHVAETTGKTVLIRDIHNIAGQNKSKTPNNLQSVADFLETVPGVKPTYTIDDDNTLTGIFIQDENMKHSFEQFPEVVLCDATHNTNNLKMPFTMMCIIDGNGHTEVIAAFLVINEEEKMIREMIKIFKLNNPRWKDINVIITDKDMAERNVFSDEIQNAELQICLFHVLRTFKREITTER